MHPKGNQPLGCLIFTLHLKKRYGRKKAQKAPKKINACNFIVLQRTNIEGLTFYECIRFLFVRRAVASMFEVYMFHATPPRRYVLLL
jgi:hypothetical protein